MSQEPTTTPCWSKEQPPGEDLFLLELRIDTPSDPDWDEGASALGSWLQIKNAYASMLAATAPLQRRLTFQIYQGAAAVYERLRLAWQRKPGINGKGNQLQTIKTFVIDVDRLDGILCDGVDQLCCHFFPRDRRVGQEWKIGNTSAERGDSLGIQLTGPKAGQWHDRATGEGGTFPKLLMANRNLSFPAACRLIGELLHIDLEIGFDWIGAVRKFDPEQQRLLGTERAFLTQTLVWLSERGGIGTLLVGGRLCVAFPVPGTNGEIVGAHCRCPAKNAKGKHDWFYVPTGLEISPLVLGQPATAKQVLFFESQWDGVALIDRLGLCGLIDAGEIAVVCTRGAEFGDRLAKLHFPEQCVLYAFPQNDEAGEHCLNSIIAGIAREVRVVRTPGDFKDLNDWTRTGAERKELVAAIKAAEIRKPQRQTEAKIHGISDSLRETPPEGNEGFGGNYDVDWKETGENPSNHSGGDTQEVPFPADSILASYYDYVITQTEGADCYIIGSILPIIAALLGRNVWVPWANGALYPNLYSLLVGPPGNMKTTSIDPGETIARGVVKLLEDSPHFHFLSHNYSPESLFDAYFKNPWRLLICDDANATLIKWQNPHDGERLSSNFLTLFDGKPLSETFRRNRTEGKLESQERWTGPTSTNVVFGVTFNGCEFRGNTQRAGLQRRFLCYVAEDKARQLHRPHPDERWLQGLAEQFRFLSYLHGPFSWTPEAETLFDQFKDAIDGRIRACDILDDQTRGRLTTACAWVLKIAMIFEAALLCHDAWWMPRNPQIVPDSPELRLRTEVLQLAIDHVEACLRAASSLDQVANRKGIAEQAQILLAYIRTKFWDSARNASIILTRTQITDSYAHNASRHSDSPVTYIYAQLIPYLIRIGDAKRLAKEGKKETYAFRVE